MKKRLTSYTFDASAQTVVHADFSDVGLAGIQLIVNVTDQIIIYNFADASKGGTLATDTLTLEYDTTSMSDTDELMILVEDGVAAQTVSGTVTANLAAGTNNIGDVDILSIAAGDNNIGNVDIASIAAGDNNIGNVDVVTLPSLPAGTNNIGDVDVLSSALPTGASTLAEQQTQTTALQLLDDAVYVDDADWTNDTSKHLLVGGVYQSTPHTVTDGDVSPALMDANGRLIVAATDNGGTLSVDDGGGAITVDGTVGVSGTVTVDGSGSTQPVSNAGLTALNGAITGTEVQVDVVGSLPAGTNAIGKLAANDGVDIGDVTLNNATIAVTQSGTWDEVGINDSGNSITVDNGGTFAVQVSSIAAGTNAIGDVGLVPRTSGGLSIHRSIDLDESEEEVKASAGQVYGVWFTNTSAGTRWLKFYNDTAANVAVGTTTPVITIGLPGNTSDDISGALFNGGLGIPFSTAICVAATTGVADADTGAPSANDVIINVFYK